jgi:hypothetical protein
MGTIHRGNVVAMCGPTHNAVPGHRFKQRRSSDISSDEARISRTDNGVLS